MKKCTSFEEEKGARYIWDSYYGIISFRYLSSTKLCLRFLLNYFARKIKGCYQSFLGNEVDFRDIMNVSSNILALITTTLMSSYHLKTLVPFCLRRKRPENAFLTLIVNYFKIVQKNKLCYSKQQ